MKLINDYKQYNVILWKRNGLIRHYYMCFLSFEFLDEDFDEVIFLKFDFPLNLSDLNIDELIKSLEAIHANDTFVILTQRKEPPLDEERLDEFIYSFSCNFRHFRKMMSRYGKSEFQSKNLLFELLDQIIAGNSDFKKIIVRQIPLQNGSSSGIPLLTMNACDLIIPHRGNDAYLSDLMFFLDQLDKISVYVGIDQDLTEDFLRSKNDYPKTSFYSFAPNPVGPYAVRNKLIAESKNELIFFQDSDDIPCADRFERISDHMMRNKCQLCGSHEIELNYFDRTVRAIRYPENVMAALMKSPDHSLLFGASGITRDAFYLCKGLSEERCFGNDTKFLLHSFFLLDSIRNVDEFLYIRRRHADSLTTSEDINMGFAVRYNLWYKWSTDFELIKSGKLKLENSSLNYESSPIRFEIKKL